MSNNSHHLRPYLNIEASDDVTGGSVDESLPLPPPEVEFAARVSMVGLIVGLFVGDDFD